MKEYTVSSSREIRKQSKIESIIEAALVILQDNGYHGLTMRLVAAETGMSLGNLQYYFKSKDSLLKSMIEHCFKRCREIMIKQAEESKAETPYDVVYELIDLALCSEKANKGTHVIFREFWVIACRDPEIEKTLRSYYDNLAGWFGDILAPLTSKPTAVKQAITLMIPYIEGYFTVTSSSSFLRREEIIDMLTNLILTLLEPLAK